MSEELISKNLTKKGTKFLNYDFFDTNRTNLNSFKKYGFISKKEYKEYGIREPDGLLVDINNKKNPSTIGVIEFKKPSEFRTKKQIKKAVEQCNDLCQVLNAKFGVISDRQNYIWINPKQKNAENEYLDRTTKTKRSYSIILNEELKPLNEPFIAPTIDVVSEEKLEEENRNTIYFIKRVNESCNDANSTLKTSVKVDPTKLAQSVWQDIYINTAKTPVKCLYNVVELFIFKFLSDLEILNKPYDFNTVFEISNQQGAQEALNYYARNSRKIIKEDLFRKGKDGTTIINGTIFVDDNDEPVQAQATLFKSSLKKYQDFGSLKNIEKNFKHKLFEIFLKQTSDKNKLGQFFTPRKVVQSMVNMTDYEDFTDGYKICDPFCGVGGFLVEFLQKSSIKQRFKLKGNEINPKLNFIGFDKGMDSDDERTIILAKANMLIYLSDILEKYPKNNRAFEKIINETFTLLKDSNLGTLNLKYEKEEDKFDVIITNPPYITGGVQSIKDEIISQGLEEYYTYNGKGLDGLALEWIIRNLKKGGKGYLVLSNGLLNSIQNTTLKEMLLKECFINGIISLPIKTFFNTPQKTYIFIITKKKDTSIIQNFPVFTYLTSNIGETLDVNRFEISGESDLNKATWLFRQYKSAPKYFDVNSVDDNRCKLFNIEEFKPELNWEIDKWWNKEELMELGVIEEENLIDVDSYKDKLTEIPEKINQCNIVLNNLKNEIQDNHKNIEIYLGEKNIFSIEKGKAKYTRQYFRNNPGEYPVYSSQTLNDGVIDNINTYDYNENCLTWTTDGIYAGTVFLRNGKFSMTTHCGAIFLNKKYKDKIDLEYLYFYLRKRLKDYAIGSGNKRVTVNIIKSVMIEVPINKKGEFDLKKQKQIAKTYRSISKVKSDLDSLFRELTNLDIDIK